MLTIELNYSICLEDEIVSVNNMTTIIWQDIQKTYLKLINATID